MATVTPGGYLKQLTRPHDSPGLRLLELVANDCSMELETDCEECPMRHECRKFWDSKVAEAPNLSNGFYLADLLQQLLSIRALARAASKSRMWRVLAGAQG